ncbi:MAG: helix-turn-helix domain-containing protein [Alphaproteobacteria bacterium]|nr:helix-turn-helix domain-containing protein [Alphaproteobacteria bacterium]
MSDVNIDTKGVSEPTLGPRVRRLRKSLAMTLAEVAEVTGLSISALSKIENDQVSPTFTNLMRLAEGLQIQLSDLVALDRDITHVSSVSARMTVSRRDEVQFRSTPRYDIGALAADLLNKRMTPLIERVRIGDSDGDAGDGMISHGGEEFVYVLSGAIEVRTEHYQPVRLDPGDSIYLDSTMAHTYVALDDTDAHVLTIWLAPGTQTGADGIEMAQEMLS